MTSPARAWDRLPTETLKAHTSFLAYVALGARRSVREAARQHHIKATASEEIFGVEAVRGNPGGGKGEPSGLAGLD